MVGLSPGLGDVLSILLVSLLKKIKITGILNTAFISDTEKYW